MFCSKCHYTSFDQLESCPACGSSWQQIKSKLNLDWLVGNYPEQQGAYDPEQALKREQSGTDVKTDQDLPGAVPGSLDTPQELELEFTWEGEQRPSYQAQGSSAVQASGGQSGKLEQGEDIAFPDLEGLFETEQKAGLSGQGKRDLGQESRSFQQKAQPAAQKEEQPGGSQRSNNKQDEEVNFFEEQDGLDFELEPEGEEVDISALFDELESDLDSRRKKG